MLSRILGLDGGTWYAFYSGIFGVLVFGGGLLANAYVTARKHNCHEPGCWRVARFPVEGTPWSACRRHHPAPPRKDSIREQYHLYLGDKAGRG